MPLLVDHAASFSGCVLDGCGLWSVMGWIDSWDQFLERIEKRVLTREEGLKEALEQVVGASK